MNPLVLPFPIPIYHRTPAPEKSEEEERKKRKKPEKVKRYLHQYQRMVGGRDSLFHITRVFNHSTASLTPVLEPSPVSATEQNLGQAVVEHTLLVPTLVKRDYPSPPTSLQRD